MKIIRFNKLNIQKYKHSISLLKREGPIVNGSRPYIGMIDGNKVVSGIWIDECREISIVTLSSYRCQGIMTKLVYELINDVFRNRLNEVIAMPISRNSMRLLKKCGFSKSEVQKCYLEFYIK